MRGSILVAALALASLVAGAARAAITKTQNFDTDPNWTGVGNLTAPNNYGYRASPSNQAGGANPGEAGGTFARRSTEDLYCDTASFADGAFNLSMPLTGSGKFDANNAANMNNAVLIGHRSKSTVNRSFIGLAVFESNVKRATMVRISAYAQFSDNAVAQSPVDNVPYNSDYTFAYAYSPWGGATGNGQLSLTVTSVLASYNHTFTVDLSAANRAAGATFDAFGIGGSIINNTTETGDVFIDDVTYTVPEPSAALGCVALTTLTGAAGARRSRRQY
jgi:hypothetical protein